MADADIGDIADVSAATALRWTIGKAMPQPRAQLAMVRLHHVVHRLADTYSPYQVRNWLYSGNALLDGERAIDLIHENRTEEVLAAIECLDAGAFL